MKLFVFPASLALGLLVSMAAAEERPSRKIPEGANVQERFLKLVDRPRVPLQAAERPGDSNAEFIEIAFEFDSEAGQRVPGLLVKPAKEPVRRRAVVIALHGTGGSKQGMRPLLRKLAEEGLIGVAIDGRYAGERAKGTPGTEAYRAAIYEAWKTGESFPFLYDTVWDVMRLIDYLETRDDVARNHIGAIGFSKGGMELYLAAAVEPRLAVAVPCIGVQSYVWALEHDAWKSRIGTIQGAFDNAARDAGVAKADSNFVRQFYGRVVPGIDREFDGPVMLPLIAPRPLLVINGDKDDRTPVLGLQMCIDAARKAYEREGAASKFEFILQPNTGHAVTPESQKRAIDWLVQHLK